MWKHVPVTELNIFDIFSFKNNDTNLVITGRIFMGSDNRFKISVMSDDSAIQTIIDLPKWATQGTSMLSQEAELLLNRMGYTKSNPDTIARYKKILKDMGFIEEPICTILKFVPDLHIPDEVWEVE